MHLATKIKLEPLLLGKDDILAILLTMNKPLIYQLPREHISLSLSSEGPKMLQCSLYQSAV